MRKKLENFNTKNELRNFYSNSFNPFIQQPMQLSKSNFWILYSNEARANFSFFHFLCVYRLSIRTLPATQCSKKKKKSCKKMRENSWLTRYWLLLLAWCKKIKHLLREKGDWCTPVKTTMPVVCNFSFTRHISYILSIHEYFI